MSKPTALIRPQSVQFTETLPDWPLRLLPDRADRPDDARPGGTPGADQRRAAAAARPGQRTAQGGAGTRVAAGRRWPAGCSHHRAPVDRQRPGGECVPRRPHRGRRRVFRRCARRREPRAVGGTPRRNGDLQAVRGLGATAGRSRCRRGQRRRACRLRQEPPRAPTGCRRDARGAGPAVRRSADRTAAGAFQDHSGVASVHADHRPTARKINDRIGFGGRTASNTCGRRGAGRSRNGVDQRAGGRPRFLRGSGGLVRSARRRPLGGVDPLRAAFCRSPHGRRAFRRWHRRRIRPG